MHSLASSHRSSAGTHMRTQLVPNVQALSAQAAQSILKSFVAGSALWLSRETCCSMSEKREGVFQSSSCV
ncbi:uncharacterized [Tachysurus ichikawai]